jgi:hypothetical protein
MRNLDIQGVRQIWLKCDDRQIMFPLILSMIQVHCFMASLHKAMGDLS